MSKPPFITGFYDRTGYTVCVDMVNVYSAGNLAADSAVIVAPWTSYALPLRTIRRYCLRVAKEIAREKRGIFTGIERQEEETP
jgi:hypothetical protein